MSSDRVGSAVDNGHFIGPDGKTKNCLVHRSVSNFSVKLLEVLAKETTVVPAVDQVGGLLVVTGASPSKIR
jgi:hypothetical protein